MSDWMQLIHDLAEVRQERDTLNANLSHVEKELARQQAIKQEAFDENDTLREEIDNLQSEVDQLKTLPNYESLKAELADAKQQISELQTTAKVAFEIAHPLLEIENDKL